MQDATQIPLNDRHSAVAVDASSTGGTKARAVEVLLNVKSGRGAEGPSIDDLRRWLSEAGLEASITTLGPKDDIPSKARQAAENGAEVVVVAGGDGTINGVASGLVGTSAAMGIIPFGTFNYFARSLGIPEDPQEAIAVIARGQPQSLKLGKINDKLFLNNASLGLYPLILRRRETVYKRWGRSRIAAYWTLLAGILRPPRPLSLKITADGEVHDLRTPLAFVSSNAYQLRQFGGDGADCVESGKLALLLAQDTSGLRLFVQVVKMALGFAVRNRDFRLICASDIRITAQRKSLLVARDGERDQIAGPFHLRMQTDALQVIAPSQDVDKR